MDSDPESSALTIRSPRLPHACSPLQSLNPFVDLFGLSVCYINDLYIKMRLSKLPCKLTQIKLRSFFPRIPVGVLLSP